MLLSMNGDGENKVKQTMKMEVRGKRTPRMR